MTGGRAAPAGSLISTASLVPQPYYVRHGPTAQPLLSTDRIVATARALVDAEGLAASSPPAGSPPDWVSGPSLYNHFRTKDEILEAVADSVSAQVDLSMFEDGRDWRTALHDWACPTATAARPPQHRPVLARGPGRRPAALRWPTRPTARWSRRAGRPREATSIGARRRYFIMGSALGSFAGGFVDDASAYDPADYPHLGQAHPAG
ncbi:AcrR family transcriptional regulator OS=Streptomyces albaduncus OX=68172 GN=FHS32_006358 PE=4 SV=1 [Streptomyces griseoloalbus]